MTSVSAPWIVRIFNKDGEQIRRPWTVFGKNVRVDGGWLVFDLSGEYHYVRLPAEVERIEISHTPISDEDIFQ